MSKIRIISIFVIFASLAISANNHFSENDPLVAQYELCMDQSADDVLVVDACGEVLAQAWLPDGTRNVALKHRAHALRALEKYDRALEDLGQAISLRPDDANAYVMRSSTYLIVEDWEHAERDYQLAIAIDPEDASTIKWWINRMSHLELWERELVGCEQLLALDTGDSSWSACKVRALIKLERFEAAIDILKEEANSEISKHKRGAYFYLGRLYLHLGYSKQETLAVFEAWKATGEDKPLPSLFLGATYLKFGDEASGQRYINEVAEIMAGELTEDPFGPWAALKTALARVVYRDAIRRYFAGVAYGMIRQYDLAKQEFAGFLETGGPNARLLLANLIAGNGFVPNAAAAKADQNVLDRGLERYMIHVGRKFSLEALGSRK